MELDEKSVCREFRHTANDGKTYNTKYYNLDAIISIGYRVNSKKANWEEQNRVAIDDYNKRVKKEALFSDNFRNF